MTNDAEDELIGKFKPRFSALCREMLAEAERSGEISERNALLLIAGECLLLAALMSPAPRDAFVAAAGNAVDYAEKRRPAYESPVQ